MFERYIVCLQRVALTSLLVSSKILLTLTNGPVAQLGARFNRTEEVEGSNPSRSIQEKEHKQGPIAHEVPSRGNWERHGKQKNM